MSKELTIKEALEQGYYMCGKDGDEIYEQLEGFTEDDLKEMMENDEPVYLAEKKSVRLAVRNASDLWEIFMEDSEICDASWSSCGDFLGQYTEEMQELLNKISKAAYTQNATATYMLTKIKLKLS